MAPRAQQDPADPQPPDDPGDIENLRARKSVGRITDEHWSVARKDMNAEALEYYRQRDLAPGVAENDAPRAHYCLECDGVLPLEYDSRKPPTKGQAQVCPHCGAELPDRVRRMFNWVEIDQVHGSDLAALLPWFLGAAAIVIALLVWLL